MRPDEQTMGHVDEGAAHAWLDGALDAAESARIEAHVASCPGCGALVAEARGLIAGASRILTALDDVPGDVIPASAPAPEPAVVPITRARRPRSWVPLRAAAAVVLMAGTAGLVLMRRGPERAAPSSREVRFAADSAASMPMAAPAAAIASAPAAGAATPPPVRLAAPRASSATMDSVAGPVVASPRSEVPQSRRAETPGVSAGIAAQAPLAKAQTLLPPLAEAQRSEDSQRMVGNAAGAAPTSAPRPTAAPAPAAPPVARMEMRAREDLASVGTGTIVGAVTDERDRPLADASVAVERSAAQSATDSAGRFVLRGVAAGATTVRARRVGFEPATATVDVRPADTARVALKLSSATMQLSQVVVTGTDVVHRGVVGGTARASEPAGAAASARVVGCYTVRVDGAERRAGSDAAPSVPARLRLTEGGGSGAVRWTRDASGTLRVTLADSAGPAVLVLTPNAPGWVGRATVPNTTRSGGVTLVRLAACAPE